MQLKRLFAGLVMFAAASWYQTNAHACSVALEPVGVPKPEPTQEMRDNWTRNRFLNEDSVVRVRNIVGGSVGTFVVVETYRGKLKPLDTITMPVVGSSACGPDRVSWLSGGVLAFNSQYKYNMFSAYLSKSEFEEGIRLGIFAKPKASFGNLELLFVIFALSLLLLIVFAVYRVVRVFRRRRAV
jgi:hypothetical protein